MKCANYFRSGVAIAIVFLFSFTFTANGETIEDGYELWLRYRPVSDTNLLANYRQHATQVVVQGQTLISNSVRNELQQGLTGLLNKSIPTSDQVTQSGAIVAGSPATSPLIAGLAWDTELQALGEEGFVIRSGSLQGKSVTFIASSSDRGVLYGAFRYLSLLQQKKAINSLDMQDKPTNQRRLLNHWTSWSSTSMWNWSELPGTVDQRYTDYARANASVGINGSVINNCNAQVDFIKSENLPKVAALADVFRKYGMKLYLSIRFDSPMQLSSSINTADPLDPAVIQWWKNKVDEIYTHIPDFGGFLVKGDSEGQPGPLQYGRTHAVGANMLADAFRPHGGIVMWRTFVYDISGLSSDRVMQGYQVFKPLDGQFADNVIIQAKNGPLDFQVREPVNPLFGQMPDTNTGIELEIWQEYTGQRVHLCWLIPQWKEVFEFDTMAKGAGSTVQQVIDGSLFNHNMSLVAGVANTKGESTRNWTDHYLAQANWYGFGRLAWNPGLESQAIADEWIKMTYSSDAAVVSTMTDLLMNSWETYERYTSPVGLGFMVERDSRRLMPTPVARESYHHADLDGVGYDRTRGGSGYVDQYHKPLADMYNSLSTCPEELLLWFHHVPYDNNLKSGKTLVQTLYDCYYQGVEEVEVMIAKWQTLENKVDSTRYTHVLGRFQEQLYWAKIWRDVCTDYFYSMSGISDEHARFGGTRKIKVKTGETAELNVKLDGSQTSVLWYKNGSPITSGNELTITTNDLNSVLIITDADLTDQGEYRCVVTNMDGETAYIFELGIARLLARYEYEQNLLDSSGNNDGTAVPNMSYAQGKVGNSAVSPNGGNYVRLSSTAYPGAGFGNGLEEFTFSFWVKPGAVSGSERIFGNFNNDYNTAVQVGVESDGSVKCFIREDGNISRSLSTPPATVSDDEWHLVAFTFDGRRMEAYVDGFFVEEETDQQLTNFSPWQYPLVHCARNNRGTVDQFFSGQLDDLRIYNYVFSQEEVAQLYYDVTGQSLCIHGNPSMDFSGPDGEPDCVVDMWDLMSIASEWLTSGLYEPTK